MWKLCPNFSVRKNNSLSTHNPFFAKKGSYLSGSTSFSSFNGSNFMLNSKFDFVQKRFLGRKKKVQTIVNEEGELVEVEKPKPKLRKKKVYDQESILNFRDKKMTFEEVKESILMETSTEEEELGIPSLQNDQFDFNWDQNFLQKQKFEDWKIKWTDKVKQGWGNDLKMDEHKVNASFYKSSDQHGEVTI
jgi:hypothetical protein